MKKLYEHILMFVKGIFSLMFNILIYVVLFTFLLDNANALLSNNNIPLTVDIKQKALLLDLVLVFGILISTFACIRASSPSNSWLKLIGTMLEIFATAGFYSIFILTGNSILELGTNLDPSIQSSLLIMLDINNILYINIGLQVLKIGVLVLQVIEFIVILVIKDKKE
ncbi:MAG: hypothetical protein ACTSRK_00160 [Promethearchaeota archaeon]